MRTMYLAIHRDMGNDSFSYSFSVGVTEYDSAHQTQTKFGRFLKQSQILCPSYHWDLGFMSPPFESEWGYESFDQ